MNSLTVKRPGLGRPWHHPSGRKTVISASISPAHLALLDAHAGHRGASRSQVLATLIERLKVPSDAGEELQQAHQRLHAGDTS